MSYFYEYKSLFHMVPQKIEFQVGVIAQLGDTISDWVPMVFESMFIEDPQFIGEDRCLIDYKGEKHIVLASYADMVNFINARETNIVVRFSEWSTRLNSETISAFKN